MTERPFSQGGLAWVIAVDDAEWDQVRDFPIEIAGIPVMLKRASELADPDRDSDLYLGSYRGLRSTPTCRKILTFGEKPEGAPPRFTLLEQDAATGTIYRGGEMVWASAPVAVWNPADDTSELAPLGDAMLLFADGPRARVTLIPNIAVVYEQPWTRPLRPGDRIDASWREWAREAVHLSRQEDRPARLRAERER